MTIIGKKKLQHSCEKNTWFPHLTNELHMPCQAPNAPTWPRASIGPANSPKPDNLQLRVWLLIWSPGTKAARVAKGLAAEELFLLRLHVLDLPAPTLTGSSLSPLFLELRDLLNFCLALPSSFSIKAAVTLWSFILQTRREYWRRAGLPTWWPSPTTLLPPQSFCDRDPTPTPTPPRPHTLRYTPRSSTEYRFIWFNTHHH